jgi:hypothetical protein
MCISVSVFPVANLVVLFQAALQSSMHRRAAGYLLQQLAMPLSASAHFAGA